MLQFEVNTSYKHHRSIAYFSSISLILLLIILTPYDVINLSFLYRLITMPFYGVILFGAYFMMIPFQNWVVKKINCWNIGLEVVFITFFSFLFLIGSFFYYKSRIINGGSDFPEFAYTIFYPIFFIIGSIIISHRLHLNKNKSNQVKKITTLKGENKHDQLRVNRKEIVCVVSAGNYIDVYYLENDILCKKTLRNTLKRIQNQESYLIKIHRSYLINPIHFKKWKAGNIIVLTQMQLKASNKYKHRLNLP